MLIPILTAKNSKSFKSLDNTNLIQLMSLKDPTTVTRLFNKQPELDQDTLEYRLDFKGKIKVPSVKNFILVEEGTERECLLFGKIGQGEYYLEAGCPLSPLQALGVCISSADRKWGVE